MNYPLFQWKSSEPHWVSLILVRNVKPPTVHLGPMTLLHVLTKVHFPFCIMYPLTKAISSGTGLEFVAKANTIASKNAIKGMPNFKSFVLIVKNFNELATYYFLQVFGLLPDTGQYVLGWSQC